MTLSEISQHMRVCSLRTLVKVEYGSYERENLPLASEEDEEYLPGTEGKIRTKSTVER